jgi:hypothetical protein
MDEAALFRLGRQTSRTAQVGLVGQDNKKFSPLAIGSVLNDPGRDFVRRSESVLWRTRRIHRLPRLRRNSAKHQEQQHDCSETKQNADQHAESKEPAFAKGYSATRCTKVATDRFGRGFVFHWMNIDVNGFR